MYCPRGQLTSSYVGAAVGKDVGETLGGWVGVGVLGVAVGLWVGIIVGSDVGASVGVGDVGEAVDGNIVGRTVGAAVGVAVSVAQSTPAIDPVTQNKKHRLRYMVLVVGSHTTSLCDESHTGHAARVGSKVLRQIETLFMPLMPVIVTCASCGLYAPFVSLNSDPIG